MYLQEVIDRVKALNAFDSEQAHHDEDRLHQDVLRAIATGQCQDAPPEDFAEEALKTLELDFTRWYA